MVFHQDSSIGPLQDKLVKQLNKVTRTCYWLNPRKDNVLAQEVDTKFIMAFSEECEDELLKHSQLLHNFVISTYQENEMLRDNSGQQLNVYQKPLALDTFLVRTLTKPGDFVISGYSGTGTTALAAASLKRHSISFESNVSAYEAIVHRLLEYHQEFGSKPFVEPPHLNWLLSNPEHDITISAERSKRRNTVTAGEETPPKRQKSATRQDESLPNQGKIGGSSVLNLPSEENVMEDTCV